MTMHRWACNVPRDNTCLQSEWWSTLSKVSLRTSGSQTQTLVWKPHKRPKQHWSEHQLIKSCSTRQSAEHRRSVVCDFILIFLHQQLGLALTHGCWQHHRAEEPFILSLSLLGNNPVPPMWSKSNGPVTRKAFISCVHTDTSWLWVTWIPNLLVKMDKVFLL